MDSYFYSKKHLLWGCFFFIFILLLYPSRANSQDYKAAWLIRYDWKTSKQIDKIITSASSHQITDIFVQVRGRGDAYYRKTYEPAAIKFKNSHDRLDEFISKCRHLNIRVHAWINVFLVGSDRNKPFPENHVLANHPEWVIRDQNGKSLLEYSHENYAKLKLEGIYLDPIKKGVEEYHLDLIEHIAKNYPFDGIHLDYFRLPSRQFYLNDPGYVEKVTMKLNDFLSKTKKRIQKYRINSLLSVAVKSDFIIALEEFGQDWPGWLEKNYIDYAFVMNYTTSDSVFTRKLIKIPLELRHKVVVGISLYDKTFDNAEEQMKKARKLGFIKHSFFSMKEILKNKVGLR